MLLRTAYARKEPKTLDNTTIIIGSVTYAVKARRLLAHDGIRARLIKLSRGESSEGCTHGIEIPSSRFFDAVVILKEGGIPYSVLSEARRDIP